MCEALKWSKAKSSKCLSYGLSRSKPSSYLLLPNFVIGLSAGNGQSVPPKHHPHHGFVPPPNGRLVTTNAPTGRFSPPSSGLTRRRRSGLLRSGADVCALRKPAALTGWHLLPFPAHPAGNTNIGPMVPLEFRSLKPLIPCGGVTGPYTAFPAEGFLHLRLWRAMTLTPFLYVLQKQPQRRNRSRRSGYGTTAMPIDFA